MYRILRDCARWRRCASAVPVGPVVATAVSRTVPGATPASAGPLPRPPSSPRLDLRRCGDEESARAAEAPWRCVRVSRRSRPNAEPVAAVGHVTRRLCSGTRSGIAADTRSIVSAWRAAPRGRSPRTAAPAIAAHRSRPGGHSQVFAPFSVLDLASANAVVWPPMSAFA